MTLIWIYRTVVIYLLCFMNFYTYLYAYHMVIVSSIFLEGSYHASDTYHKCMAFYELRVFNDPFYAA